MTYSGAGVSLGAYTLTLLGGGTFSNSNALTLGNADSVLRITGSNTVSLVTVSTGLSSGISITESSTISTLTIGASTPLAIASGKTLSGSVTLNSSGTLQLTLTGTLGASLVMNEGRLDIDEDLTISGAITHTASSSIDIASGKTLTYSGAGVSLGAYTLTL